MKLDPNQREALHRSLELVASAAKSIDLLLSLNDSPDRDFLDLLSAVRLSLGEARGIASDLGIEIERNTLDGLPCRRGPDGEYGDI